MSRGGRGLQARPMTCHVVCHPLQSWMGWPRLEPRATSIRGSAMAPRRGRNIFWLTSHWEASDRVWEAYLEPRPLAVRWMLWLVIRAAQATALLPPPPGKCRSLQVLVKYCLRYSLKYQSSQDKVSAAQPPPIIYGGDYRPQKYGIMWPAAAPCRSLAPCLSSESRSREEYIRVNFCVDHIQLPLHLFADLLCFVRPATGLALIVSREEHSRVHGSCALCC